MLFWTWDKLSQFGKIEKWQRRGYPDLTGAGIGS
jgi:hypothetical protein